MDRSERIGSQNILKLLIEFSVPAIVGMLVSALYNVIDRVFIGHSVGALGIAAVTIAFPVMTIQFAFACLIGVGATSNISIKLGQNNREGAQRIVGNTVTLLILLSILLTVGGLVFLKPLLVLFGASKEVLPYAEQYTRIILAGSLFNYFGFGLNNIIRGEGKPVIAMLTMLIGTLLNVILAPLFIFVFHWGMQGAALATVCSQAVSGIWITSHFIFGSSTLRVRLRFMKLDPECVKEILLLGVAPFCMQIAQCALTAIMNVSLAAYGGDTAISGMGIINSISTLIILPVIGINQGSQPIIGYNFGAKKFARVKKTLGYAVVAATVISTIGFAITRLFPRFLIEIFDSSDKALIDFGSYAVTIFLAMLPVVGFQIAGSGYFQAVGKPKQSMILSLSRQVLVLIPALLILPHFLGMRGVLLSGPISDFISSVVTAIWLLLELRHFNRQIGAAAEQSAPSDCCSGFPAPASDTNLS